MFVFLQVMFMKYFSQRKSKSKISINLMITSPTAYLLIHYLCYTWKMTTSFNYLSYI